MNPDFAIILNLKLANKKIDADKIVKTARNVGVRAISCDHPELLNQAGAKYTIRILPSLKGIEVNPEELLEAVVSNRQEGKATIINLETHNEDFTTNDKARLQIINNWMHICGHALNEGRPSTLQIDADGFVLENRHASYQKYIFLKAPLASEITVFGLKQKPSQVEWIDHREKLESSFDNNNLKIKLKKPQHAFPWLVIRLQAHRPEDDIAETKF